MIQHTQTSRARLALILRGTIDATLAANLPTSPISGDTYKVSVAGNFEASALISPTGAYFDAGNYVAWNAMASTWDKIDTTENISDAAYDATSWDGDTRNAPSKNAVRDKFETLGTMSTQNANNVAITGGAIDGTTIGGTTPAAVTGTTVSTGVAAAVTRLDMSGITVAAAGSQADIDINLTPKGTGEVNITKVDIDGGTIDGTTIGATTVAVTAASGTNNTHIATTAFANAAAIKYAIVFG